ncbi:MAG: M20/M25/M40 family metallo-hydrolase [Candidatus Polarisedimenticolia bacterium]
MSRGAALLRLFEAQAPAAVGLLRDLVALDSPTADKAAVDRLAARVARELRDASAAVTLVPQVGAGDALQAVFATAGEGAAAPPPDPRPALLLGHLDTVWPAGEAARRPFAVAGGCATGPGVYDMKAGIVLCVLLARAIRDGAVRPCLPVALFLSGDEETGSPCSRPHLESAARRSRYVLGLEPCNPDGGAKTVRKGVGRIVLEVTGVPAHAGIDPERGVNAIEELAAQILAIKLLQDAAAGISVHAGLLSGGVAKNVVAPAARAEFDVRVPDPAAWTRIETAVLSLRPRHPRARLSVRAALTHPPMVRTDAVAALLERARQAAAEVGFTLHEGGTGGGSDGSYCAALGVPVLDGLGVEGAGAHAADERVRIDRIAPRAAFLARLLEITPGP